MPFYDFNKKDEEITLEKLLENYKYLEYITNLQFKENPSLELSEKRRQYRNAISMIKRVIRKKEKNEIETMYNTI